MTPLIQEAVKLAPEPETAMWFDVGSMEVTEGMRVPMEVMLNLPFQRTGVAGIDSTGQPFSLWMTQGNRQIAIGGCAIGLKKYFEPFAFLETDEGLQFYRKDKTLPEEEIRPVIRMVGAVLMKLYLGATGYRATPQKTFINKKRAAKGKPALTFDWHTVTIEPPKLKNEPQGGTHASPRLHDRRGHWRNHPSGKRVWVKSCKVGSASKGVVFKDYKTYE